MIKKIIKIILVLICMITIFLFSSDSGDESSVKSDGIITRVSEVLVGHKLKGEERNKYIDMYSYFLRKTAHFTIYFILGILLISLVSEYTSINYKSFLIALLIAFLYALSDEVHQLYVPGRSGQFSDVLLDSFGSLVGISVYFLIYKLRSGRDE